MTLLWAEGFEGFGTTNGVAPSGLDEKYDATNRISLTDIHDGRIAGKRWYANTGSIPYMRTKDLGAQTAIVVGFGFHAERLANQTICTFYEPSDTAGLNVRITLGGEVKVYRSSTLLGTASGIVLEADRWYFIEIKATISNTTGTVVVNINETQVLSLSSQDTQQGSTAEWRKFRLQGSSVFPDNFSFDDWYILNTSGSQNNDFLGSIRIDGILPDGDSGTTDWTPDSGTTNYTQVDENPHDTDTSYVESSTSTDQDLYDYAAVPTTLASIHGIQINTVVRETDASDFTLKTLVYSGTTLSADTAQAIAGTSYEVLHRVVELDPDTSSAWTSSGINSAQFGIEVG